MPISPLFLYFFFQHNVMKVVKLISITGGKQMRVSVQAGDVDIDLGGAAIQIDEALRQIRTEHTWTVRL